MKRIISFMKYYSCFILPLLIMLLMLGLNFKYNIINEVLLQKVNIIVDISVNLIGILLTVLTIYLSFPKNETVVRRMKKSGHNFILLSNILLGITMFSISILLWLFFDNEKFTIILFTGGLCNMIVSGYYIASLSYLS